MYSSTVMHSLINFVNLKIKSTQSFGCAHRDKIYVYVFRGEWLYVYEYLCLCDIKREYQMNRTTAWYRCQNSKANDRDVKMAKQQALKKQKSPWHDRGATTSSRASIYRPDMAFHARFLSFRDCWQGLFFTLPSVFDDFLCLIACSFCGFTF
jgi:hypothetical protein